MQILGRNKFSNHLLHYWLKPIYLTADKITNYQKFHKGVNDLVWYDLEENRNDFKAVHELSYVF